MRSHRSAALSATILTAALAIAGMAGVAGAQSEEARDACLSDKVPSDKAPAPQEKIGACTKLIKSHPNEHDLASALSARARIFLYAANDYDKAIADFSALIRLDPKNAAVYGDRGLAYRKKGDLDRAIADYTDAIRIDPKYARAFNDRGTAYFDKATTTARSPITAKRFSSIQNMPSLSTIAAKRTTERVTTTVRLSTTTPPSGSSRNTPGPLLIAASPIAEEAIISA